MSFAMHRVFCATPFEMEEERLAFYQTLGDFNESHAMSKGVLFVAVSLVPTMADKRPYQGAVTENIRSCSYYLQLLEDSWGPPQRNFERDFASAQRLASDPAASLDQVVLLLKTPLLPHKVEPDVAALRGNAYAEFADAAGFRQQLKGLLSKWLTMIAPDLTRLAVPEDEDFLRTLITATLIDELQARAWPDAMRGPLLDMQYRVRREGVRANFPCADVRIILREGKEAGWIVVDRTEEELHVVDIAILPELRSTGLGSKVLEELKQESMSSGKPIRLHVNTNNRAVRLYERLGFQKIGGDEVQHFLEFRG